jgi:hypothetical protein
VDSEGYIRSCILSEEVELTNDRAVIPFFSESGLIKVGLQSSGRRSVIILVLGRRRVQSKVFDDRVYEPSLGHGDLDAAIGVFTTMDVDSKKVLDIAFIL